MWFFACVCHLREIPSIWGLKETGLLPATNHWDETAEPLLITKGSDLKYCVGDVWVKFSRTERARISEKVLKGSALRCSAAWIWGSACPGTQIAPAAKRSVCKVQVWGGRGPTVTCKSCGCLLPLTLAADPCGGCGTQAYR